MVTRWQKWGKKSWFVDTIVFSRSFNHSLLFFLQNCQNCCNNKLKHNIAMRKWCRFRNTYFKKLHRRIFIKWLKMFIWFYPFYYGYELYIFKKRNIEKYSIFTVGNSLLAFDVSLPISLPILSSLSILNDYWVFNDVLFSSFRHLLKHLAWFEWVNWQGFFFKSNFNYVIFLLECFKTVLLFNYVNTQ